MTARNPFYDREATGSRSGKWDAHRTVTVAVDDRHARTERVMIALHRSGHIDLYAATVYRPGSPEKVAVLAARYECGCPLWADGDRTDHGPPPVH